MGVGVTSSIAVSFHKLAVFGAVSMRALVFLKGEARHPDGIQRKVHHLWVQRHDIRVALRSLDIARQSNMLRHIRRDSALKHMARQFRSWYS